MLSRMKSQIFTGSDEIGYADFLLANYFKIPCINVTTQYLAFEAACSSVLTSNLEAAILAINLNPIRDCPDETNSEIEQGKLKKSWNKLFTSTIINDELLLLSNF